MTPPLTPSQTSDLSLLVEQLQAARDQLQAELTDIETALQALTTALHRAHTAAPEAAPVGATAAGAKPGRHNGPGRWSEEHRKAQGDKMREVWKRIKAEKAAKKGGG